MGIAFGVLTEWSTINLVPEYQVDVDEEQLGLLQPIFECLGRNLDPYESDTFSIGELEKIIVGLEEAASAGSETELFKNLLRTVRYAKTIEQPLQYCAL